MYQGLDHFKNCFQYKYTGKNDEAIFIFHGFPSQKNRNKDIAHALGTKTPYNILVHHYEGLGESLGKFNFIKSLTNAEKFVAHHLKLGNYKKIHFVGHSWGGFISLNLLRKFNKQTARLVLLSPFNQIPKNKNLNQFIDALFTEYPHCFYETNKKQILKDFQFIQDKYDLVAFFKNKPISQKIKILQAKNDLAVPEVTTKSLLPYLGSHVTYTELELDHSFTMNRAETIKSILKFFSN
ncbi:MAG: alpha/beta fold hydrolase [Bdellovibrionaceae bacterium]|nr:alpha/beta fold hydrolase [Bacteriovoracaceae bacterium]MCK6598642.1 alpha/beta fold hydrolase [Pseudobdellovibrionaceae bacterium]NUM57505.1 alpha/beta fold hydrolase [Pseudobdellovibrionaceae bacterium]